MHSPVPGPCSAAPAAADEILAHLAVLQLSDTAFPSGRYTLSHGLEALSQSGRLAGRDLPAQLLAVLAHCLRHGVGPSDGVALACAHRATGEQLNEEAVIEADSRLHAAKLAREARETSARTGRALLRTAEAAFPCPQIGQYAQYVRAGRAPGNHAVALGVLTASLGVARREAVTGELYSFAASWVSAATRLALIDHRSAQALLRQVHPVIVDASRDAAERHVTEIASCTPLIDVVSMRHEEAELRLFAS